MTDWKSYVQRYFELSEELQAQEWQKLSPEQQTEFQKERARQIYQSGAASSKGVSGKWILILLACIVVAALLPRTKSSDVGAASDSIYNSDVTRAHTSDGLSNADLAWHATNTYGWDCNYVIGRTPINDTYFLISCSNGKRLRVYPRVGQHPRITNEDGGYR